MLELRHTQRREYQLVHGSVSRKAFESCALLDEEKERLFCKKCHARFIVEPRESLDQRINRAPIPRRRNSNETVGLDDFGANNRWYQRRMVCEDIVAHGVGVKT